MSLVLDRGVEANAVEVKRNDVWFANLGQRDGSEQRGPRPVMILSNNRGNKHSAVVIVVPISAQITKAKLPTHVVVKTEDTGVARDSVLLFEQITTIDKSKLIYKMFELPPSYHREVNRGAMVSIDLF